MKKQRIVDILKWLWIALVLAGAGWYFYRHYQEISQYLGTISIKRLILSFMLLIAGKFALSDITRLSLKKSGYRMPYSEALTITTISQLGKYLPGGIWHFAGKFGFYKLKGITTKKTTQAMVIENIWLLSSAGIFGAVLLLAKIKDIFCPYLKFTCNFIGGNAIAIFLPLIWLAALLLVEHFLFEKQRILFFDYLLTIAELGLIWLMFGTSFWLIFPPRGGFFVQVIGAFSISWLAGYVAVIAPGGIGVREISLAALLGAFFASPEIAIYAAMHRLLWVLAEVFLGGLSALIFGIPAGTANSPGEMKKIADNPGK